MPFQLKEDDFNQLIKDTNDTKTQLQAGLDLMQKHIEAANDESKNQKELNESTKAGLATVTELCENLTTNLQELEQKGAAIFEEAANDEPSFGKQFIECDSFKDNLLGKQSGTASMEFQKAIINATGSDQPLVEAMRVQGIIANPDRILTVRDLCPVGQTSSNMVQFTKENVFTNNAGPQVGGSPEAFENVTKPESNITFTLASQAVETLAHWLPASKQVLSDAPMLRSYIDGRLMYGLKFKEEQQLLNGTGANGELNGIITQATAYAPGSSPQGQKLDNVREAIKQGHLSEYRPTAIVLHPTDWFEMETLKVGSSRNDYVIGDPRTSLSPNLWGLPVVVTNSIAAGTFLVGAFSIGCQIWDREQANIEVSTQNSDNFVKNMVTVLAEERIALTVYRPTAFISGSFA